jgi:phosphate transport system protein
MELHFDQEQTEVKDMLLRMSSAAEQSVAQALKALTQRDVALARQVDAGDTVLDHMQMDIDERVIELIALRQPKARDLRFLIVIMHIASELERVGDQAVNIAHRAEELCREPQLKPLIDIPHIAEIARGMIRDVLDSFVYARPDVARQIIERDNEADKIEAQLHRELVSYMVEDPHTIGRALNLMGVAHSLERIADHATNIAEEVVYLYEARDIRHQASAGN